MVLTFVMLKDKAGIAQLVEQRTENPRVTSSSLVPGKYQTISKVKEKEFESLSTNKDFIVYK